MKAIMIVITSAAMLGLTCCAQFQRGIEFTKARIVDYCATTTALERDTLRSQLVYDDGSGMIRVFCEPHGST